MKNKNKIFMFFKNVRAEKITPKMREYISDPVAVEKKISVYVNNSHASSLVASPCNLRELGAGYVISEGISDEISSVDTEGTDVFVYAENPRFGDKEICSAGGEGFCGRPGIVTSSIKISSRDIESATDEIVTDTWIKTGGVHCSVLFKDGSVLTKMSDVGRHNTVDKVIGFAALNSINPGECYIGCTGRQPYGMVKKCANAKIPVIISKAASTTDGIQIAEESGVTLICFARGGRYTIYSHPQRVEEP